jgi:hypothetical protein
MKSIFVYFAIGSLIILGAGCSQKVDIADESQPAKQAFVERRTAEPPSAPVNIPAPTPVNIVEVVE